MKATILAAGHGGRMRGFTNERSKCLIDSRRMPLPNGQLDALPDAGFRDVAPSDPHFHDADRNGSPAAK